MLVASAAALAGAFPATADAEQAFALAPGNLLLRFDTGSPGTVTDVPVTGIGAGQTLRGIDFRPATGQLFGTAATTGQGTGSTLFTYIIDPGNGAASFVGANAVALTIAGDVPGGYDFNPKAPDAAAPFVGDRIRYVNINDENARLDPNTGAVGNNDTDLTPAAFTSVIAEAYDRNTSGAAATTLYAIDREDGTLAIQGGIDGTPSPSGGVVTDLAPLGITLLATSDGGFDISPSGVGYAALTATDAVTRLYTVNLVTSVSATPALTLVGVIGNGAAPVYSLAIAPPAPPEPAGKAARTLSFDASKNKLKKGKKVRFSGLLDAPTDAGCEANQTLSLQRQRGAGEFETFEQVQADAGGAFAVKEKVKKTYSYRAVVAESDVCAAALSGTEKVKVKKKK